MPRHRSHSIDFKRQVVAEYHAGETLHALGRRHDLSRNLIRIWVEKAEAGSLDQDMASAELLGEYEARIAALGAAGRPPGAGDRVSKRGSEKRTIAEKRAYIRDHRPGGLSIERGCALMGLPRSTFYAAPRAEAVRRGDRRGDPRASPTSSSATATAASAPSSATAAMSSTPRRSAG